MYARVAEVRLSPQMAAMWANYQRRREQEDELIRADLRKRLEQAEDEMFLGALRSVRG